jgi:selenide,water dikinase
LSRRVKAVQSTLDHCLQAEKPMKSLDRRKRVMERSMRLGHCICDPKKPCPCDLFREMDVCTCAGERLEAPSGPVQLTRLVEGAGCASKIDQATLKAVLGRLPATDDPRVLVGMAAGDDAGVFRLSDDLALVQTVDVFAPSVDDPYLFGQIAAANSLSDVYAMGGQPLTALSIIGFPTDTLPEAVMGDILRGGIDKMAEAGVPVIGGHSIKDGEVKAGFAVTGLVDPARILTNAGAQPGDALLLTKPIGTGIIAFAAQIDRAPQDGIEEASRSMASLNRTAAELIVRFDVHACTDVTGFGLMGHLSEMARASGVDVELVWDDVPVFPGVLECVAQGMLPGAAERNRESSSGCVRAADDVHPTMLDLLFDPQTSGGLLIAVPAAEAQALLAALGTAGISSASVVGKVLARGTGQVMVRTTGARRLPVAVRRLDKLTVARNVQGQAPETPVAAVEAKEMSRMEARPNDAECCAEGRASVPKAGGRATADANAAQQFQDFLRAVNAPGSLDAYTKRMLAIALSVLARCEPCVLSHMEKARQMGISEAEIEEAAWMAISFGGSPVMMFYNGLKER